MNVERGDLARFGGDGNGEWVGWKARSYVQSCHIKIFRWYGSASRRDIDGKLHRKAKVSGGGDV
jgi:hypothetical protein